MLMHGFVGDIKSPRPTVAPPQLRLSELPARARTRLLLQQASDLPRFARATLTKAQLPSQNELRQSKPDWAHDVKTAAVGDNPSSRRHKTSVTMQPTRHGTRAREPRPRRWTPSASPPPIPSVSERRTLGRPPHWHERPRDASGRSRGIHDGLEGPATLCPIVRRVKQLV